MSSRRHHDDPFPRAEAIELVKRLPTYAKLALELGKDDRLAGPRRAALVGAGTYVISPIGLVPGFIPLVGQLDDLWLLLRAIRYALDGLPPVTRAEYLTEAGIGEDDLQADFASVRDLLGWTARLGRDAVIRVASQSMQAGRGLATRTGRLRRDLVGRLAQRSNDGE